MASTCKIAAIRYDKAPPGVTAGRGFLRFWGAAVFMLPRVRAARRRHVRRPG